GLCAGLGAGPDDTPSRRADTHLTDSVEWAVDETAPPADGARLTGGLVGVVGDAGSARGVPGGRPAPSGRSRAPGVAAPSQRITMSDLLPLRRFRQRRGNLCRN